MHRRHRRTGVRRRRRHSTKKTSDKGIITVSTVSQSNVYGM